MQTKILGATDSAIADAGELLKRGELVAFPTETVYGLGANAFDAAACAKIYRVKGRPSDNPLILHIANRAMADMAAAEINETAAKLIAAFCPGPLTLVLPKARAVPSAVTGGLPTVGVRWPANEIACRMILAAGVPIAAPSANLSGRPSPTTAAMTAEDLAGKIPLILDGGATVVGLESTIVDCTTKMATILRPGAITAEMLAKVAGDVCYDPGLGQDDDFAPKAPGMKYRHYAPKAPLTVVVGGQSGSGEFWRRLVQKLQATGQYIGVLADSTIIAALRQTVSEKLLFAYGEPGDLTSMAAKLYEGLRYFDTTAADFLLAQGTANAGLGAAIMNRLLKASGGRVITAGGDM